METFFLHREREKSPIKSITMDMARHSLKSKLGGREVILQNGMEAAAQSRAHLAELIATMVEDGKPLSIFGSTQERTIQSGLYRALGDRLTGADIGAIDPHDIVRWLEAEKHISVTETPLLGFQLGDGEYTKGLEDSYGQKRLMGWYIDISDNLALSTRQHPDRVTPLSVQAENVALFIYCLGKLRAENMLTAEECEHSVEMVTSHQTILESFLYKAVKAVSGEGVARKLFEEIPPNGFAENQGITVRFDILNEKNELGWQVRIDFSGKTYTVSAEQMISIMQDGVDLREKLAGGYTTSV